MVNEELYPELRAYIFMYCGKTFWIRQGLGEMHLKNLVGATQNVNYIMYNILTEGGDILKNENVSELTNDSYEAYKHRITERIFTECRDELELNLCPKCNKIARTPWAKQCRLCFYNWH
ncbi:MAG: hypothetical protein ABIO79_02270 [Ferruginibacter sp.]